MSEGTFLSRLPRLIEPAKLAQQELVLQGYVLAEDLPRVLEVVLDLSKVDCLLAFKVDEQYRRIISGKLLATAQLCCQRCLEAVSVGLEVEVNIALIKEQDQAKDLPARLDPWLVEEGEANLYELVEEELLLSLPQVAWHEDNCIDPALYSSGEPVVEEETLKENPFKMLEKLKHKD